MFEHDMRAWARRMDAPRVLVSRLKGVQAQGVLREVLRDAVVLGVVSILDRDANGKAFWRATDGNMLIFRDNIDYIQVLDRELV